MDKLYELKEMLCRELEKYAGKDVTASNLEYVDKLAHAIKNIDKIIEMKDEGSYRMSRRSPMNSYDGGYDGSYAQRRDSRGRYSREYSRHDGRSSRADKERIPQINTENRVDVI